MVPATLTMVRRTVFGAIANTDVITLIVIQIKKVHIIDHLLCTMSPTSGFGS